MILQEGATLLGPEIIRTLRYIILFHHYHLKIRKKLTTWILENSHTHPPQLRPLYIDKQLPPPLEVNASASSSNGL